MWRENKLMYYIGSYLYSYTLDMMELRIQMRQYSTLIKRIHNWTKSILVSGQQAERLSSEFGE